MAIGALVTPWASSARAARSTRSSRQGAGFADLEQGIFRELGKVSEKTPIATCVHSSQVVAEEKVVMEGHDSALNFIATELELVDTQTPYSQPAGVVWEKIRPDQYADIPFLKDVRAKIEARKGAR